MNNIFVENIFNNELNRAISVVMQRKMEHTDSPIQKFDMTCFRSRHTNVFEGVGDYIFGLVTMIDTTNPANMLFLGDEVTDTLYEQIKDRAGALKYKTGILCRIRNIRAQANETKEAIDDFTDAHILEAIAKSVIKISKQVYPQAAANDYRGDIIFIYTGDEENTKNGPKVSDLFENGYSLYPLDEGGFLAVFSNDDALPENKLSERPVKGRHKLLVTKLVEKIKNQN